MHKSIILILISLFIFGCEKQEKVKPVSRIDENTIRDIVVKAVNGDRMNNDSLSGLIDYSLPLNSYFSDLKVEKIVTPINKTFFILLLEYPNPVYNCFAVYDSALHLILLDKSLNGQTRMKSFSLDNRQYIEIDESFLSKDILEIGRVSLYSADSTVRLGFRAFTKFIIPTNKYYQTITEISPERIKTNISSLKRSLISDKSEIIPTGSTQNDLNESNLFSNFIKNKIAEFKRAPSKPEITDEVSALQSVGITKEPDTLTPTSFLNSKSGYYITIDESWKEIKDININGTTNKLKGDKFYNPLMGTNIFIAEIPEQDSAEVYFGTSLSNITQGKYRVRFANKIEKRKYYVQYFEFSCGKRKFVMVFEASKFTYDKYKTLYQDIINSFIIEC